MAKKEISYTEAMNEIEKILSQIENNELDMDELIEKVKRASSLIELCKGKLTKTDTEIQKILETMNS